MPPELPRLTLLQQRTIEARVLGPFIRTLQEELGTERANAIVQKAIARIASAQGREQAQRLGRTTLADFKAMSKGRHGPGDLEIEVVKETETEYVFRVVRCRFAEMYREMGLGDIGHLLSCNRDFAFVEGFNPRIRLQRTQTIMQGAPFCDFAYRVVEDTPPSDKPAPAPAP
ncbi:MAG: L-2-amino-thiazoline-4-carboxylic acid hydrolase [Dehalococcoidia bacterium]|nr:L-2-amino-thiazoline-4-carboxylic acid hydrolase [Dehalococcoidia bacterium]MDW8120017.1 L-2-amino-thiazoline-4-carboxylic acid hydrolase [Chloroflexota bacterium]